MNFRPLRNVLQIVIAMCLVFVAPLLAQVGNSVLTGTVEDATKARIPGVDIVVINVETGVERTVLTNDVGAFNIPNLSAGVYTLRASLPGFQRQAYENIQLGATETLRFSFTLQVAAAAETVEVVVDAQQLLTQGTGTVGDALEDFRVRELPIVGNNVLDLVSVLGGSRVSAFGADSNFTTLAGIGASYVNTTVNGVTVSDQRYSGANDGTSFFADQISGIYSTTRINPDLVQEVRLILTPVDAELGRGNGQVQITTRSGTNQFRGTARWDVRNPALNARSWLDNRNPSGPPTQDWYNQNQFTFSYGGPIIQNKTFFFALWDQNISRSRTNVTSTVLTPCARNGIYRFFPNWVNGNVNQVTTTQGANPATAVVDINGAPMQPATNPDGTPYTQSLQYFSIYGRIRSLPAQVNSDCSNVTDIDFGSPWDANRPNQDPTGFVGQVLGEMPMPNEYTGGDGLNTAIFRWVRGREGDDDVTGATGQFGGNDTNRKQLSLKFDHNINQNHRANVSWTYERNDSNNEAPEWPTGFWGTVRRRPQNWAATLNSTISPTMLNQFTFGLSYNKANQFEAMDDTRFGEAARNFFPEVNGIPVKVDLSIVSDRALLYVPDATEGNVTKLWTFKDTFNWTRGNHAFKFGGEIRRSSSRGSDNGNLIPRFSEGAGQVTLPDFEGILDSDSQYGAGNNNYFRGGNEGNLNNLLLFQSGSVGNITQLYFLQSGQRLDAFENWSTGNSRIRDWHQHEAAVFVKDDWKVTRDLTLNLGVRWEYYGVPFEANGLLPVPIGGGLAGGFGMSGDGWEDWFQANPELRGDLTTLMFAGPNSPNPDLSLYPADRNNFGPAVGFAWQVPWFGERRTVIRGGYQVTFQGGGNAQALDNRLGTIPGSTFTASVGAEPTTYARLADFGSNFKSLSTPGTFNFADYPYQTLVPLPITNGQVLRPMQPIPVGFRTADLDIYDPNYVSPYVQNFSLSVTRSIGRNVTVDVRYVGTRGLKLFGNLPINQANYITNGLLQALNEARAGGNPVLLDQMLAPVRGTRTGADFLRTLTTSNVRGELATGDYDNIADTLATYNSNLPGQPGEQGRVLRAAGFAENFIVANPQFDDVRLVTNPNTSNYHALQAQFTLRPTLGINYQGTFTWSRSMASPSQGFAFLADREKDYGLQFQHRLFDYRGNGTFELPFGPNKPLLGNTGGWVARLVEGWRLSTIFQLTTGRPNTIGAANRLYGGAGAPDVSPEGVAQFGNFPAKFGDVSWPEGENVGTYFQGMEFIRVPDPQCGAVTTLTSGGGQTLRQRCENGMNALARPIGEVGQTGVSPFEIILPDGRPGVYVLQNPSPASRGSLGGYTMEGPGLWLLDAAMSKTFNFGEDRTAQIRFDARNLLNHPTPDDPGLQSCLFGGGTSGATNLALTAGFGDGDFGAVGGKCVGETPARQFQASLRITF